MTALSDRFVTSARRIITRFGQAVTFTRSTPGTYDTTTRTTAAPSVSNYSGIAVVRDFTAFEKDLESVQQDDVKLLMDQTSTVPIIDDVVTINSKTYKILEITTNVVNGVTITYELQLRLS